MSLRCVQALTGVNAERLSEDLCETLEPLGRELTIWANRVIRAKEPQLCDETKSPKIALT